MRLKGSRRVRDGSSSVQIVEHLTGGTVARVHPQDMLQAGFSRGVVLQVEVGQSQVEEDLVVTASGLAQTRREKVAGGPVLAGPQGEKTHAEQAHGIGLGPE